MNELFASYTHHKSIASQGSRRVVAHERLPITVVNGGKNP
jgi:hypothetical protein